MQERERFREPGLDAEFIVDTVEELEERFKNSRHALLERAKSNVVVKGKQLPWRLFPQGLIRWYNPDWGSNRAATDFVSPFQQLIPHHSGRHRHQGGLSLFVLDGKGYTVLDGVRQDWQKGDLIMLPLTPGGCEHQHFNLGDKPARWMALHLAYTHAVGETWEQMEGSPLWKKYRGNYLGPWAGHRGADREGDRDRDRDTDGEGEASRREGGPPLNRLEELFGMRDEQRERIKAGRPVIRFEDIPWETNQQGKMKWYLHPNIKDVVHRTIVVYVQEIPPGSRSGKMQHQGGWFTYVWEGKGYTLINGKRYDWESEDMVFFPVNGNAPTIFQHVNTDPERPALLIAGIPNLYEPLGVDLGTGCDVLEECPEWRALQAGRGG